MNVVVDTSVAIAWYLQESFSVQARLWQDRVAEGQVHAIVPPLHYLEFANVLRTYVRRREMTQELAEEVYALHLEAPLDCVPPPPQDLLLTAFEFGCTAYDAAFVALARLHDCPVVTAERTTTPWVAKLGDDAIVVS